MNTNHSVSFLLQGGKKPLGNWDHARQEPSEEEDYQDSLQTDGHLLGGVTDVPVASFGHDGHSEALCSHAGVQEPVTGLTDKQSQSPACTGISSGFEGNSKCQDQTISQHEVEDERVDQGQLTFTCVGNQDSHSSYIPGETQDADDS